MDWEPPWEGGETLDHGTLPRLGLESGGREGGNATLPLLLRHHAAHVGQELLRVVDDAVLNRPADAADTLGPARLVVQADGPGAVQHLQVLDGVLLHNQQVCQEPRAYDAELDGLTTGLEESFSPVQGGAPDDLQRMESGFLQELHLLNARKAHEVIGEAGIRAYRHPPARVLVVVDEVHPRPVESLPRDLVPRGPIWVVRAVACGVGGVEVPQ